MHLWRYLSRWPLLLVGIGCIALGIYALVEVGARVAAAIALLVIGALVLGAGLVLMAQEAQTNHDERNRNDHP